MIRLSYIVVFLENPKSYMFRMTALLSNVNTAGYRGDETRSDTPQQLVAKIIIVLQRSGNAIVFSFEVSV